MSGGLGSRTTTRNPLLDGYMIYTPVLVQEYIKELEVRCVRAEEELRQALDAFNLLAAKTDAAEERLTWISDPSYVGNFAPLEVIEIHRKWAKDGLALLAAVPEKNKP